MEDRTDKITARPPAWLFGATYLAAIHADEALIELLFAAERPDATIEMRARGVARRGSGRRCPMSRIDLDDTTHCPLGHRCESCGGERDDLVVSTATTPLGVLCLTLCPPCAEFGGPPPVTVGTAVRLVGQHAGHLGIDLDEMAQAMREEL